MNEQQIRNLIRQEIQANDSLSRFNLSLVNQHRHTGSDGAQINQNSIIPGSSVEGSITFAQSGATYRIATNFNPTTVQVHGNAIGGYSAEKFLIIGNAKLGGNPFYLQPGTANSVIVGGPQQNIIQSCSYLGTDIGSNIHTLVSEGHIANVEYPKGTILARATISSFDKSSIYVFVDTLSSGWQFNLSFTIT